MRIDIIISRFIGDAIGWFIILWIIPWIKSKRGIKSTPSKQKCVTSNEAKENLQNDIRGDPCTGDGKCE